MKVLRASSREYLKENSDSSRNADIVIVIGGLMLSVLLLFMTPIFGLIVMFLAVGIGFSLFRQSEHYDSGIQGEEAVTANLTILDDSYSLIDDVVLNQKVGNIDHILLSRKGIFLIETKNFTGKVECYGD